MIVSPSHPCMQTPSSGWSCLGWRGSSHVYRNCKRGFSTVLCRELVLSLKLMKGGALLWLFAGGQWGSPFWFVLYEVLDPPLHLPRVAAVEVILNLILMIQLVLFRFALPALHSSTSWDLKEAFLFLSSVLTSWPPPEWVCQWWQCFCSAWGEYRCHVLIQVLICKDGKELEEYNDWPRRKLQK